MPDSHRNNFYYLNSERRLTAHLVRAGKSHKVAPLAEAVRAAAEGLQRFEPGQIAVIASARMTNEELFMAKRVIAALNPGAVDIVPRTKESDGYLISADRNPNTEGAKKILGVEEPGSKLAAIRKGVESGEIKAVVALHENLLKDAGFSADQLAKIEFLVSSHILANPTASNSAVVFAGAGFAEKRGSMINVTGRLQRLNRAIEPPGQATDDWEVLRDLAAALGAGNGLYAIEDVFKALAAEVPEFEGLTLSRIGDLGTQVYETGVTIPLIERERARIAKGEIVG
ncbi:MAG: molybdopterin-dependent oxidoreductase [Verrucomicrobiales bacterium]